MDRHERRAATHSYKLQRAFTYAECKIPYRLPELKAALRADPEIRIQITEGEKDTGTLVSLGLVATTNPGRALSWTDDLTALAPYSWRAPRGDPRGQR